MHRDDARRTVDEYRLGVAGELENDLIDNLAAGEVDRAGFLRGAAMLGMSAGVAGTTLGAFGAAPAFAAPRVAQKKGGRLKLGVQPLPAKPLEPHLFGDHGTLVTGSVTGEWLVRNDAANVPRPELALSWSHDSTLKVWTFQLRKGVKFANGQGFTSKDVVATYDRLTDPGTSSQALSALGGVLSKGNTKAKGDYTVVFTLDAATASFPTLVSQATYQAMILPWNYALGDFKAGKGVTTGALQLVSYTPGVGAKFNRNPHWWGGSAFLDGVDLKYYSDEAPMIAALSTGALHLVSSIDFSSARKLFGSKKLQVFRAKSAGHRHVAMLTKTSLSHPAFRKAGVRQALALSLNRPSMLKTNMNGYGAVGNDAPFAPGFAATDPKVPQRKQNLAKAKQLLAANGFAKGFKVTLTTHKYQEIPKLAQEIAASARKIGIDIKLDITADGGPRDYYSGTYSGGETGHGTTPWLNTPLNITDWNHRPVPNVLITSAFMTPTWDNGNPQTGKPVQGVWNEALYANPKFDTAARAFLKAASVSDQRRYEKQMATLLLADTPVIIPYFLDWILLGAASLKGFQSDPSTHVYLSRTSLS